MWRVTPLLFLMTPVMVQSASYWSGCSQLLPATIYCKDGRMPQGYGYFLSNDMKPEFGRNGRGAVFVLDGVKFNFQETDSIKINMIPGYADSAGWRFKIIEGDISAFMSAPEYDEDGIIALQKGNGELVRYSEIVLREMVSPCTTALCYLALGSPGDAIREFNSYKDIQHSYKLNDAYRKYCSKVAADVDRVRLQNALKEYHGYYPLPDKHLCTPNCTIYLNNNSSITGFGFPSLRYSDRDLRIIRQQNIALGVFTGVLSFAASGGEMIAVFMGGVNCQPGSNVDKRFLNYLSGPALYASPLEQSFGKPVITINKETIEPGQTDSVLFNIHTGVPCDTFWSFRVISGRISAWSRFPVPFATVFTHLQKDDGPRVPYSDRSLREMVKDNICASLLFNSLKPDSLRVYRTLAEYNHPSLAFRSQLDSIQAVRDGLNKNTFAYQRESNHLSKLWTKAQNTTRSDSAWEVIREIKDPNARMLQVEKLIAMDSTYSPALALMGDLLRTEGDTTRVRAFYTRSLKYSHAGFLYLSNMKRQMVFRFERKIRAGLAQLGATPTY